MAHRHGNPATTAAGGPPRPAMIRGTMTPLTIADIGHRPEQFSRYIDEVGDGDLHQRLAESAALEAQLDLPRLRAIAALAYAPGKWTATGVLQHIADTERVFTYRALRFARGDRTALPGFDENLFAATAARDPQPFDAVVAELRAVRAATMALFAGFSREALLARGTCSGIEIAVGSMGFAVVGHHRHHVAVLNERYIGLHP